MKKQVIAIWFTLFITTAAIPVAFADEGPDGWGDNDPYWILSRSGMAICGRLSDYPNGYLIRQNGIEYCRKRRGSYFQWSQDGQCMEWTRTDGWPVMELPLRYCEGR
ncbi:MAG: hypothetical protein NDJ89_10495 [Oligoflexia bacterium]|nr:hypothetical protein [Oligoflexia bacterium]